MGVRQLSVSEFCSLLTERNPGFSVIDNTERSFPPVNRYTGIYCPYAAIKPFTVEEKTFDWASYLMEGIDVYHPPTDESPVSVISKLMTGRPSVTGSPGLVMVYASRGHSKTYITYRYVPL